MSLFDLVDNQLQDWLNEIPHRPPLIVGLSGPQGTNHSLYKGSGKTTLVSMLSNNPTVVSLSLDDFYYDHNNMLKVAEANPGNPFLEFRGCPGTHDLSLLNDVLKDLVSGTKTNVPIYDKAAFNGRGDRLSSSRVINANPKIVILEGWCLGFKHTSDYIDDCHLRIINQNLKSYESIYQYFNAFVHLVAQDIKFVYDWRFEQEESLRKTKKDDKSGLCKDDLKDFIDRFIPVYSIGVPKLRDVGLFPEISKRQLQVILDHNRRISSHHLI